MYMLYVCTVDVGVTVRLCPSRYNHIRKAVRTPFGVYLVCVPSTLVSDRLYRSSYYPFRKTKPSIVEKNPELEQQFSASHTTKARKQPPSVERPMGDERPASPAALLGKDGAAHVTIHYGDTVPHARPTPSPVLQPRGSCMRDRAPTDLQITARSPHARPHAKSDGIDMLLTPLAPSSKNEQRQIAAGSRLAKLLVEEEIDIADLEGADETSNLLGKGAFGEVRKVTWRGTPVAAKLAHQGVNAEQKMLFLRELELLVRVRHPNIVQFLGYVDRPFMIVMEYLPMGDLKDFWAERRGIIAKSHKTMICIDVLRALAYLHNRKPSSIIHRDIKPTNVLMTRSGVAKLTDFGLGRILGIDSKLASPDNSRPASKPPSKHGGSAFANLSQHAGHAFAKLFSPITSRSPSRHNGDAFASHFAQAPAHSALGSTANGGTYSASSDEAPTVAKPPGAGTGPVSQVPAIDLEMAQVCIQGSGRNSNGGMVAKCSTAVPAAAPAPTAAGVTLLRVPINLDTEPKPSDTPIGPCRTPGPVNSNPSAGAQSMLPSDATAVVGTANYMAPEAARAGYNEKVDIYSAAVTFFELYEATEGPHASWASFSPRGGFLTLKTPKAISPILKQMGSRDPELRPTALELVKAFTDTGLARPPSEASCCLLS